MRMKKNRTVARILKYPKKPRAASTPINSCPRCPDPVGKPKKKSQKMQLENRDEAITINMMRMGITLQFMLLDCPTRSEWYVRDGTIATIRRIVQPLVVQTIMT
jgi:hypothetical protein